MNVKEFLKKHPGLKKCIEEQVIQREHGKNRKYREDHIMHITIEHLDETQLDKEKVNGVLIEKLFGYDNKTLEAIKKELGLK